MEELARRLPDGWTLVAADPASGRFEISDGRNVQTLLVSDDELEALVEVAGEDSVELWGEELAPVESATRLISIHLMESLETRDVGIPRQWVYADGRFSP
jgi:hypothetical protein